MIPLNQKAILVRTQNINARGEYGYTSGLTALAPFYMVEGAEIRQEIKVNWQGSEKMVRNVKGELQKATASVFMAVKPLQTDLIRYNGKDHKVISIEPLQGLTGRVVGYEVLV